MRRPARAPDDPAPAGAGGRRAVRIASYNIHRCLGSDGRRDPERVAQVLRELECDLVGLQEVDNSPGAAPESMQLDYLAARTGLSPVAGLRIVRHLGQYGNALLTRHPILRVRRHDLSHSRYEARGALDVELNLDGVPCRVIVTHLGLVPGERRHQMRRIIALAGDTPVDEPLALLGDINEWLPVGRPLRWMHAVFGRPPSARSFPARFPLFALDRIWTRPRGSLRAVSAHRSALARTASDHLPIVGEWTLGRGTRNAHSGDGKEEETGEVIDLSSES
jgi:endonuclease/exonuclease/phosphatase family metal-dependent hydrolase